MAATQPYQQAINVHIDSFSSLLLTVPPGQWNGLYLRLFHNMGRREPANNSVNIVMGRPL